MIYFVRHGSTDWNDNINEKNEKDPRCQGLIDIPLNEHGIQQALEVKNQLTGKKFDKILCSPLIRARQTLEIIMPNTPYEIEPRLIERDFGEFEGLTRSQFDFLNFWTFGKNQSFDRAESLESVVKRAKSLLDELKQEKKADYLLVSHGGIGCVLKSFFESPQNNYVLSLEMPHAKAIPFDLDKLK